MKNSQVEHRSVEPLTSQNQAVSARDTSPTGKWRASTFPRLSGATLAAVWLLFIWAEAQAQPCTPCPSNIVAWWPGDDHPYDVVEGIDAIPEGGAAYISGNVDEAFSFGGTYQRVLILESPNTDLSSMSRWTIEAWVRPTSFDNAEYPTIYSEGDRVASLGLNKGTGRLESWINGGNRLIGTIPLTIDQWTHVALVYSNTVRRLYVNGALAGTGSGPRPDDDPYGDAAIGNVPFDDAGTSFAGAIDEVSLYDRALGAAEILAIANAGPSGKCFGANTPVFVIQPASQAHYLNGKAQLIGVAMGTPRPTYQWLFNGAALAGETNYTLVLANLTFAHEGNYALVANNTSGSVTSTVAPLIVKFCADTTDGLVAWWPGDGSALDVAGNNHGAVWGGVTYPPGVVSNGVAFGFNGSDAYIAVPDSPALGSHEGTNAEMTVEIWIYLSQYPPTDRVVLAKGDPGRWEYTIHLTSSGVPGFYVYDPSASTNIAASGGSIPLNGWHHLVGVLKKGQFVGLYMDGDLKAGTTNATVASVHGPTPLYLGRASTGYFFNGRLDEVTIYSRALTSNQVAVLYALGSVGKCADAPSPAPAFVVEPADKYGYLANSVALEGLAVGTPRPHYQWQFWGTNLPGATNATLALSDLKMSDAGPYTLVADNIYGVTSSRVATLTVRDTYTNLWDFENGWDGWISDNYAFWQIGAPKSGTTNPASGSNCAATLLAANYPQGSSSRLISPIMILPAVEAGEEVVLRFWHWFSYWSGWWYEGYGCQSGWGGDDYGQVQVQVFNQATGQWSGWTTNLTVSRQSAVWSPVEVDLSAYAGKRIRLGFLHVDVTEDWSAGCGLQHYESSGWFIDDVRVERRPELVFTGQESFERGWNGWWATRGIWGVIPVADAPSGANCISTVGRGSYPWLASSRLVSPKIDVPAVGAGEEVVLRLWHWFSYWSGWWYEGYGCQSGWGGDDYGQVQVQVFDPAIGQWSGWTTNLTVTRQSAVWSPVEVDLSAYAGKRIRLGFLHVDVNEDWSAGCGMTHYESSGWFIDDVRIEKHPELLFSGTESFEGGWNGWHATGGIWGVIPVADAPSGANCISTVGRGSYPWLASSRLVSPKIDVPAVGAGEEVVLRFWHWFSYWSGWWYEGYGCQSGWGGGDYGQVQVQVFNPVTGLWSGWTTNLTVTRQSAVWSPVEVDLSAYAGKRIRLGFLHVDVNEDWSAGCGMTHYESSGWSIDDVQIEKRLVPRLSGPKLFEEGWGDWFADQGVWQFGFPSAGPGVAHSGTTCAGTVLGGNYPILVSSRLISPAIDIPALAPSEPLMLRFWQCLSYAASDHAYVQIRMFDTNTGTWSGWTNRLTNAQSSTAWSMVELSLTNYAGQRVQVAFYHTDSNESGSSDSVAAGWYLDDVFVKRGDLSFDPIPAQTNKEANSFGLPSNLTFRVTVSGTIAGSRLSFSLIDPPEGARINTQTGDFIWAPSECQGPGTYRIPVYVVDRGNNNANDLAVITVTVNEVNEWPWLFAHTNSVDVLQTNLIPLVCWGDPDCPKNLQTFTLLPGAPPGASIDSSGIFRWAPTPAQLRPEPYLMQVKLCDNGTPNYCVTNWLSVTVTTNAVLHVRRLGGNSYEFTILKGRTDRDYELQQTATLCGSCGCTNPWDPLGTVSPTTIPFSFTLRSEHPFVFFRLKEVPR